LCAGVGCIMAINPGLERQMYPGVGEFIAGKAIGRGENEASPFEKDFPSLKEGVGNPITPMARGVLLEAGVRGVRDN
jgi:hypothetical protein